jgi:phenylalanyl-tRNA synthetase beta chain
MKFPLSWLKEYVDVDLPPQQIAKILTSTGIEVDGIQHACMPFDKVVVAEVLEVAPHPNADKLCLAKVTDGIETYRVVCGAPNCRAGMKTALALLGATLKLPDGEEIKVKKSKIRGEESFGMLCSGKELGISPDEEGIIEFAEHLKPGSDVAEIYSDTIFDVSLTPNLSHAASIIGIARELAAACSLTLKLPEPFLNGDQPPEITVEVSDAADCPIYMGKVIEGISGGNSPDWMQNRLLACGIRPSFAAVDVSNYVLLETGQPLHIFDLDKIPSKKIIVRRAHAGECIETLDGKHRTLTQEMLVIADPKQALAIAGVMGGANSEVRGETQKILIESAYFKPGLIRKTSKALGLTSDASKRFERGVDPNGVSFALNRAANLLQQIQKGVILKGTAVFQAKSFPEVQIRCRLEKVNGVLGTKLSMSEVEALFHRLAFKTVADSEESLLVTVPTYRVDISQEIDLVEEVARLVGFDHIPRKASLHHVSALPNNPFYLFQRKVRTLMIGEGLQEFLTCDLLGPAILEVVPDPVLLSDSRIAVLNPTSIEQSVLRTSLLQGLLQIVKFNNDRENHNIAGFEVGRIHLKSERGFLEPYVAGIVLSGKSRPHHIDPKPHDFDFYDLKGMIENIFEALNIKRFTFRFSHLDTFHSGRQAEIQVDGMDVGTLGEIHPSIQRKLDLQNRVYFAELNLTDLLKAKRGDLKMRSISPYPASWRDWTANCQESLSIQELVGSIERIPSDLLEEVSLVDIYRNSSLGAHRKNVTLHFVYRDKEKTVSQEEVDKEHGRIIQAAEKMILTE